MPQGALTRDECRQIADATLAGLSAMAPHEALRTFPPDLRAAPETGTVGRFHRRIAARPRDDGRVLLVAQVWPVPAARDVVSRARSRASVTRAVLAIPQPAPPPAKRTRRFARDRSQTPVG